MVPGNDSARIWPLRCVLQLTCLPMVPTPAWPTNWLDQKPVRLPLAGFRDSSQICRSVTSTQAGVDHSPLVWKETGAC